MEKSDRDNQQTDTRTTRVSIVEKIEKRDEQIPSPEERAGYILNLIKDNNNEITNWDLLCFCSEYLSSQVLVYDWLESEAIKLIASRVQLAHYTRDEIPESGIK